MKSLAKAITRKGGGLSSFIPMPVTIIISIVYVIGYALSFCMLRIEHEADQELYTKGDRALSVFVSLGSFITVAFLLIAAWVRSISATGYWNRPVKQPEKDTVTNHKVQPETEPINDDDDDE